MLQNNFSVMNSGKKYTSITASQHTILTSDCTLPLSQQMGGIKSQESEEDMRIDVLTAVSCWYWSSGLQHRMDLYTGINYKYTWLFNPDD
jgi:hypothetical protein